MTAERDVTPTSELPPPTNPAYMTPRQVWHLPPPDRAVELSRRRRVREAVFERDGWRCRLCHKTEGLTYDHMLPESLGGPYTVDNGLTLCTRCNQSKGSKPLRELPPLYVPDDAAAEAIRIRKTRATYRARRIITVAVKTRDRGRCVTCGVTEDVQVTRRIPTGSWTVTNLHSLCHGCRVGDGPSADGTPGTHPASDPADVIVGDEL